MLSLFLHIYQPPTQFPKITKDITRKCYQKIVELLKKYPSAKITLNIPASLTEQLAGGNAPSAPATLTQGPPAPRKLGAVPPERSSFQQDSSVASSLLVDLRNLVERGQVELTGTAAYHPLLTKIPESEVRRQIRLNDEINKRYFGDAYHPRGFFPPEMAYTRRLISTLEHFGFEWIILDQFAFPSALSSKFPKAEQARYGAGAVQSAKFRIQNSKLRAFFRNNALSLGIAFGGIKSIKDLTAKLPNWPPEASCPSETPEERRRMAKEGQTDYCILAMDGETFGHHLPGQLELLSQLFAASTKHQASSTKFKLVTVSELLNQGYKEVKIEPKASSWGPETRWDNPKNPVHQLQWRLTNLAIDTVRNSEYRSENSENSVGQKVRKLENRKVRKSDLSDNLTHRHTDTPSHSEFSESQQWLRARQLLDRALHSDQYFWAAHDPCWHPQMVERGARMLRDVVLSVPDGPMDHKRKAQELYSQIVKTGKKLYGEEIVIC